MQITRLQVEEGFLNDLDLSFAPGLNVLIGPRGAGKTSVIELIRFALGVPAHTDKIDATARTHARWVLASGRVTLTAVEGESTLTFVRSADEDAPRIVGSHGMEPPVVLSQGEIEEVATDVVGRMRLVDAFRESTPSYASREAAVSAEIASLTAELREISFGIQGMRDLERASANVPAELAAARAQEADLLSRLGAAGPDREQLQSLTANLAAAAVRADTIVATLASLRAAIDRITQLSVPTAIVEPWPPNAGPIDVLANVRSLADRARTSLRGTVSLLEEAVQATEEARRANEEERVRDQDASRLIRTRLESLQAGAGAVTRQLADLHVRNSQLEATRNTILERDARLREAMVRRDTLLDQLDALREARYEERDRVVGDLNASLGPRIRVNLLRFGNPNGYENALLTALRGSGLQYNSLAPQLVSHVSPRELAGLVESADHASLSELADITPDRSQRIIEHLRTQPLESILTAEVEDAVDLTLLDGAEYKPTTQLSTGQRCTVVLPILLSHANQLIVLDQPEDHLDNAFVVDTVVRVLVGRSATAQTILATHNANIPVLGDAANVVYLGSTGQHGFKRAAAPLDNPEIVDAITSVMEGGREAFRRRSAFYHLG